MAYYTVVQGGTFNAADLDQIINALQQPSGGQERGTYYLQGGSFQGGWAVASFIATLSRNSTPVSITLDATITTFNASAPFSNYSSSNGFQAQFSAATGSGLNN